MIQTLCKWGLFSGIHVYFRRKIGNTHAGGIEPRELVQREVFQRATNGRVDALPGAADPAQPFDAALTGRAAALGNGDGALKYIENLRRGDLCRTARQTVAALCTAG